MSHATMQVVAFAPLPSAMYARIFIITNDKVMSPRRTMQLRQLGVITIAWTLVSLFMSVYDHMLLNSMFSSGPSVFYSFSRAVLFNCTSALIGAMLGGSCLVFYVNEKCIDKPISYTVSVVTIVYFSVIAIIITILTIIASSLRLGISAIDSESVKTLQGFIFDPIRVKNILAWYVVVAFTQILLQIGSRFGFNTFGKIIKGKYNVPHEEKKIFMFIDLNDSTMIAENLGNEKYHSFLRDFFSDITDPIVNNNAHIYQYVGDQVVLMWDYEKGVENTHCVNCFFEIKKQIQLNKAKYLSKYGTIPSFKGAVHFGKVVAGEVGVLKREVTYSGDVLNTTARIQGLCNTLNSELITSSELLSVLTAHQYTTRPLGSFALKGRDQKISLQSLSLA